MKRYGSTLVARVRELCAFPDEAEAARILSGMRWIGMFAQEKVAPRQGNLLDTLCARLEGLMKYEAGERDLVMLQHKFVVEWADGKVVRTHSSFSSALQKTDECVFFFSLFVSVGQDTLTSTLEAYGNPIGHSAMALLVGVPCGIAVQFVLDGVIRTPGILAPYSKELCDPLREALEKEGISMVEKVL